MRDEKDPAKITCPYTGHRKLCSKLRDTCPKWIKVFGTNPQTGEKVDEWDCADTWATVLQIEQTQQVRQLGAAIESFRNEMVRQNEDMLKIEAFKTRLIDDASGGS